MSKELRSLISLVMLIASVVVMICGGFLVSSNESAFLYTALMLVYLSIIIK